MLLNNVYYLRHGLASLELPMNRLINVRMARLIYLGTWLLPAPQRTAVGFEGCALHPVIAAFLAVSQVKAFNTESENMNHSSSSTVVVLFLHFHKPIYFGVACFSALPHADKQKCLQLLWFE